MGGCRCSIVLCGRCPGDQVGGCIVSLGGQERVSRLLAPKYGGKYECLFRLMGSVPPITTSFFFFFFFFLEEMGSRAGVGVRFGIGVRAWRDKLERLRAV